MPLLTSAEKQNVQRTLGNSASAMYSTIARLFFCSVEDCGRGVQGWRYSGLWGIVVPVFDRSPPASRHIKLLDFQTLEVRFNQELYESVNYQLLDPTFHAFEFDHGMVGLQFSDAMEANEFADKLRSIIPSRPIIAGTPSSNNAYYPNNLHRGASFMSRLFQKSPSINPGAQVSQPTAFQHVVHIGYDSESGFDLSNLPAEWKQIFQQAGISKKQLQQKDTAAVIFETIQNISSVEPNSPVPGANNHGNGHNHSAAPPPFNKSVPPPAPPMAPPMSGGPPPPPAPPLAPPAPPPPMAPPMTPSAPSDEAGSSDYPSSSSSSSSGGGSLAEALAHVQLRKAAPKPMHDPTESALPDVSQLSNNETNSLAGLLSAAMAAKFATVHQGYDDDQDDDDDDWDD